MPTEWLKTETAEDANAFNVEFWDRYRKDIQAGQFWVDRIKTLRGEPDERLRVAMENLPVPGAFKEAAIATRALIREARKQKLPYSDQLSLLYWLAAIASFGLPYSEKLEQPGYNVLQAIPGKTLTSLPFSYLQLGYEKLELLNKTDIKWLVESWGQPDAHTTLHELHHQLWDEYEDKLCREQKEHDEKFTAELFDSGVQRRLAVSQQSNQPQTRSMQLSQTIIALLVIVVLVCVVWWISQ